MLTNPILNASAYRGQGLYAKAIQVIEDALPCIDPDYLVLAYREAFLAARDLGDVDAARSYAKKIAAIEPELPSIKGWV
ncbi:hypothetical protein ACPCHQ_21985 [Ralstonia thomasii]|uniref:hypothetical protein n=1 Tax=Ralstonia thomasii TaxID=3058596 RepID=UPI003C2F87AB